jgi:predicted deacylase
MNKKKWQLFFISLIGIIVLLLIVLNVLRFASLASAPQPVSTSLALATNTATATPTPSPTSMATPLPTETPLPSATPEVNGKVIIIGYSVQNRSLEVYQFGTGEHHLMILAGIHGGYEANTVALADELIARLKDKEISVPADVTLYVLRNLNPDGYAKQLGPDGRANADNVDLNRNWDANWQAKWSGTQCWSLRFITAGKSPFSEPETKALADFLLTNKVQALIDYHSAALGLFAGSGLAQKQSGQLAYQLSLVSPYSYPPVNSNCQYTGQMIDWASAQGIAAVDLELRTHTDTDLAINLKVMDVFLDWKRYLN